MCSIDNICVQIITIKLVQFYHKVIHLIINVNIGQHTVVGSMNMLDASVIGKVIQKYREEKGLSQEVLSGLADIGRSHLSAIERGKRRPTLDTFFKICEALHVRPSTIMAEIECQIDDISRKN